MALTKVSNAVTWADNVVPSATPDASQTSNQWTLDATCVAAQLQVRATAAGAGSTDQLELYLEEQDGTNWDTPKHSLLIGVLDLNLESALAVKLSIEIPAGASGAQRLRAQTIAGASLTNAMTVTAVIREHRSS